MAVGNDASKLSVEQMFEAIMRQTDKIEKCQEEIKGELKSYMKTNDLRVGKLEVENAALRKKLAGLEKDNESLSRAVNYQNLVLVGLPDSECESESELRNAVKKLIEEITNQWISFDTVMRLGTYKEDSCRIVRIRFMSHTDRNFVFHHRINLGENLFLNEDLPFSLRRDHAVIRKKVNELKEKKTDYKIDWRNKIISCKNGTDYEVHEGKVMTKAAPTPSRRTGKHKLSSENISEAPPEKMQTTESRIPMPTTSSSDASKNYFCRERSVDRV